MRKAQDRRAAGCLLFSDPREWNPSGKSAQYPNGWELPDTGIQRGTISQRQGDALSSEYPSKRKIFLCSNLLMYMTCFFTKSKLSTVSQDVSYVFVQSILGWFLIFLSLLKLLLLVSYPAFCALNKLKH